MYSRTTDLLECTAVQPIYTNVQQYNRPTKWYSSTTGLQYVQQYKLAYLIYSGTTDLY